MYISSTTTFLFLFKVLFHIDLILRPVTKKQNLVGHGHSQGSTPVFVSFFPVNIYLCCWILMVASTFLVSSWNSPAVAWTALSFILSQNMSHSDNVQTVSAAATLRSSFAPTMRRNQLSGSALSRRSLAQQASNRKSSGMPMPLPACPSKSFGIF